MSDGPSYCFLIVEFVPDNHMKVRHHLEWSEEDHTWEWQCEREARRLRPKIFQSIEAQFDPGTYRILVQPLTVVMVWVIFNDMDRASLFLLLHPECKYERTDDMAGRFRTAR